MMRIYILFIIFIYVNENIQSGNNNRNGSINKKNDSINNKNNINNARKDDQVKENITKEKNEKITVDEKLSVKNDKTKENANETLVKNEDPKIDIPDDFLSDIDENFNMFYENNKRSIHDSIPFTISTYKEFINFNLYVRKKNEIPNTYNKSILTLIKMSGSVDFLFKLMSAHSKIWGNLEKKHPSNKFIKYVKSHFEPSIGLFYENNSHSNHYKMIVKSRDNSDIKKDITVDVSIKILRLGPIFKLTWFIDNTRKFNSSFMISVGWQTNLYWNKCCCHYKDTWLTTRTDYGGFDNRGYSEYAIKNNIKIIPIYLMLHLDFGYYFFKLYIRFYSPITKEDDIKHALFMNDNKYNYFDSKSTSISGGDNKRKLILNKWTMSIGGSLTL